MRGLFNHHTHTSFCDGSDEPAAYVKKALKAGFHTLGFSSHAPVPFKNSFAIQDENDLMNYCNSIRALKNIYSDRINILLGLEIDYIKSVSRDFKDFRDQYQLDYVIGSVHLVRNGSDRGLWFIDGPRMGSYDSGMKNVFRGDIHAAVKAYYHQTIQMILTQKPEIIGHIDKVKMHNRGRFFTEDELWYRNLVMDTLDIARQCGSIIEVNTRGIYTKSSDDLYPAKWILREILARNIPVTLSSDAHKPEEVDGYYAEAIRILKNIGFRELVYFKGKTFTGQRI